MFLLRAAAKLVSGEGIARSLIAQLANMTMFHLAIAALNARSRRRGSRAAQQVGGGQRPGVSWGRGKTIGIGARSPPAPPPRHT
jgi:hypothetical protein